MKKIKCALIGPGNIGTDLLYKLRRSPVLEPVWMVGVDPASDGLARAREFGLKTTDRGVDGLLPHVAADDIRIAFDATSAYVHRDNSDKLTALGVKMIDLTPAAIGPYCVPPVNLDAHLDSAQANVNMVTCGGGRRSRWYMRYRACSRLRTARSSRPCRRARSAPARARTSTNSRARRPVRSNRSAAPARARRSS